MKHLEFKRIFLERTGFSESLFREAGNEIYITANSGNFHDVCLLLHGSLSSPVLLYFAEDNTEQKGVYTIYCGFLGKKIERWVFAVLDIPKDNPVFPAISNDVVSAQLFEREIKEMFGLIPTGSPDARRLRLHDEVWPDGFYPLRKKFARPVKVHDTGKDYVFDGIEGEGVFEVPVGPVHAGIIGPGHFRFSVAGEPIINLELRLGFTHRGVEKLFENKNTEEALKLAECVSGDAAFAHGLAFCLAAEKAAGITVTENTKMNRAIGLELERIYNHVNDIGGMAVDVAFSYSSALASIIKENILRLNERLSNHRYLKGVNGIGRCSLLKDDTNKANLLDNLQRVKEDAKLLKNILYSGVSFMDRVDTTGTVHRKTAEDYGITGLAARASGIELDLRQIFPEAYENTSFEIVKGEKGDVLSRLNLRFEEIEISLRVISELVEKVKMDEKTEMLPLINREGIGLGAVEGWRGPVLYWVKLNKDGAVERCKVVDASFNNWQALALCVHGNIIPDFPVCNKSFDLSYPGGDL